MKSILDIINNLESKINSTINSQRKLEDKLDSKYNEIIAQNNILVKQNEELTARIKDQEDAIGFIVLNSVGLIDDDLFGDEEFFDEEFENDSGDEDVPTEDPIED